MSNLFSFKFWFNARPGPLVSEYQRYLIIFVVILAILTAIFFVLSRRKKNLYNRFWSGLYLFCLTNTITGVLLLWFIYESIPFLSSRFWFILWAGEIIVWLFFLAKRLIDIPKRRKQLEEEKQFKKYIP